ncbi:hypothetical protein JB92DRAFT_2831550 [Gautieria morchelliformis]|nr:hypothetical protein JB92DRAFT_2831550 [Gautieria morchelliformis]
MAGDEHPFGPIPSHWCNPPNQDGQHTEQMPGPTSLPGRAKKSKVSGEENEDVLYSLFMSNILDGLDRDLQQRIYACAERFKGNGPTSNLDLDSTKSSHAQTDQIAPLYGAKEKERAVDVSQETEMA